MALVDILPAWPWRALGRQSIWDRGNAPFILAWYQRDYHRVVPIFILCTAQKATKPLQRQGCRPARTSCPCLEHGTGTSTPERLQPRTVCAQSITQTQPSWAPTLVSDTKQQWVLLAEKSGSKEMGGRPPLKYSYLLQVKFMVIKK